MKVKILEYTSNPIESIYRGFKICYASGSPLNIKIPMLETSMGDVPDYEEMINFIKKWVSVGHESPLEHASITFAIEGVSRTLTHQLVRHRIASYNQQSQRYVKLGQFEYVIPPEIAKDEYLKQRFIDHMKRTQDEYDYFILGLMLKYIVAYKGIDALDIGNGIQFLLDFKHNNKAKYNEFEKKAIEDARYVFPNACCTNIIVTMNLRNFRHFFAERICKNAQWEIQDLAEEMMKQVKDIIPFADYKARKCGVTCNECANKGE